MKPTFWTSPCCVGYDSQQAFTNIFTGECVQDAPNKYRENEKKFYPLRLKFELNKK